MDGLVYIEPWFNHSKKKIFPVYFDSFFFVAGSSLEKRAEGTLV